MPREALCLVACICMLGLWRAGAADKPPEKPPEKAPEAAPPAPTFADEPAFLYEDGGRRDPFTFLKVVAPAPGTPGAPGDTGPMVQSVIEEIKATAERNYVQAEQLMMSGNPREAVTLCDKGLDAFREIKNVEDVPALQDLRERLFRLRKAAERLRNRADAELAFKNMNLRVSGVVARERDSRAIVNNKVVGKGDLILASDNSEGAIVDDIVPGRVIVRFRGYKMVLDVSQ
jgi:hypothetical protein